MSNETSDVEQSGPGKRFVSVSSMIIIENQIVKGIRGNLFDIDHVSIPEGVIGIFSNAFDGCSCLTSITFPTTLELIGDYCFRDCHNLTSVTLECMCVLLDKGNFVVVPI